MPAAARNWRKKGSILMTGDFLYRWQTLIAVLISATVALIVASIAWRGVQRQIANQRAIASRAEDDAYTAIADGSAELYGMLNLVWRAVDVTLSKKWPENREANFGLVRSLRELMPDERNLDAVVEIAQELGPTKRRKFLLFMNMVRSLYRHYRQYEERPNEVGVTLEQRQEQRKLFLFTMRTYLTHAYKYLEAFDPDSAAIFIKRSKTKVDQRRTHEHFETSIARAERGENWLT